MPWWEILREGPFPGFVRVDPIVFVQIIGLDDDGELDDYLIETRAIECFGPNSTEAKAWEGYPE